MILFAQMILFLAGLPRVSDVMVKMMVADELLKDSLIKYFRYVVYCSALEEKHILCPSSDSRISSEVIDICENAYINYSRKFNSVVTSQYKNAAPYLAEMNLCATRSMR